MNAISVAVVNAIPAPGTGPLDPSLAGKVARIDWDANTVEVWGTCSAGNGTAFLCKWFPEAAGGGQWFEWLSDAATGGFAVNSALRGGRFHTRLAVPEKVSGDYLILFPAMVTASECRLNGRNF